MPSKNSLFNIKPLESEDKPILGTGSVKANKPKINRITKGFQVEIGRASKWDILVAQMKSAEEKKTAPELLDEALDFIFEKYSPISRLNNKDIK